LTSNLGSVFLVDPDLDDATKRESVLAAVRQAFKPEFLNRLDDIVVFDALSREDLAEIVDLQIQAMAKRLEERRLTIEVSSDARQWLAEEGYDPAYGARPLRRLIQTEVGDALAKLILAGEVVDGDTVKVDRASGDGLVLSRA